MATHVVSAALTIVVTLVDLDFSLKLQPPVHASLVKAAFGPCLVNIRSAHAPCAALPIGILLLRNSSLVHRQPITIYLLFQDQYSIFSRSSHRLELTLS
jgi:hypothetical protein